MNLNLATAVAPLADDVYDVTAEVWATLLGEEAALVSRPVPPGTPFDADDLWSASVSVSGNWVGQVTVSISEATALALTRAMLALDGTPSEADTADAVGELVNMIGGSIKSLMPGPSQLSLPAVAIGRTAFPNGFREVARVDVTWCDEPLRVSVHVPTEGTS